MRVVEYRTGAPGRGIHSDEEALLVLSDSVEDRLRFLFDYEMLGYRDEENSRRSVGDVVAGTAVLRGAVCPPKRPDLAPPVGKFHPFTFDPYTARNVLWWPLSPSELRRDPALSYARIAELAARLNRRLREEAAQVLRECAGFVAPNPNSDATAWSRFCAAGALGAVSVEEVADAIAGGPVQWTPASEWTPGGGVDGDPFTVCRYRWACLRAQVRLEPAELLARHLAGDADMTLYRVFLDYGCGTQEVIWPRQNMACCGTDRVVDDVRPPLRISNWGRHDAAPRSVGRQCLVCGGVLHGSWLTCWPAGRTTLPHGVVEALDALPAETLAAGRREGLHAIAPELPVT